MWWWAGGPDDVRTHLSSRPGVFSCAGLSQLGTGHAVMTAREVLRGLSGLCLCADGGYAASAGRRPLHALQQKAVDTGADAVALTALFDDPAGYGRIVRNSSGAFQAIVEDKDASRLPKKKYGKSMPPYLLLFRAPSAGGARSDHQLKRPGRVLSHRHPRDHQGCAGVSSRHCAWGTPRRSWGSTTGCSYPMAAAAMRRRINESHMRNGVTIIDPANTYIDAGVVIGQDTVIYPGNVIEGVTTSIGA